MKTNFTLLIACLFSFALQAQTTRYVRSGGTGDGSSWANASGNLQMTINAAAAGDEVWVAEGVYTPTHLIVLPYDNSQPVDRRSTFTIHSGVKLYGGFAASGNPGMNDRNFEQYPSILSGDIGVANDSTDNCYRIMFFPASANAIVDGFTFQSGTANGNSATADATSWVSALSMALPNYKGGAIYMHNADNITIANCKFISHRATYEGGAVYINGGSHQFLNCSFQNNIGGGYGGAFCGVQTTLTMDGCAFDNNRVGEASGGPFPMPSPGYRTDGGAVGVSNGNLTLLNSVFTNNVAHTNLGSNNAHGGAVALNQGNHLIENNTFTNNSSTHLPFGVQICLGGGLSSSEANTEIRNNFFQDNLTHGSGGAIFLLFGTHYLEGNRFLTNLSIGSGGAIQFGGTSADAVNNIFEHNASNSFGGAMYAYGGLGSNKYVNNTFYANSSVFEGGAIYLDGRTDHILNNIFYENTANNSTVAQIIRFFNSNNSTLKNNLIQVGDNINGNISGMSPQFIDAANGDYTLSASSPCINTGSNDHYLSNYSNVDFAGNPRIYGNIIDMGAIESQAGPVSVSSIQRRTDALQLYPNLAMSGSTVQVITHLDGAMGIYDSSGKLHQAFLLKSGNNAVEIQLPPGMYFVRQLDLPTVKLVIY